MTFDQRWRWNKVFDELGTLPLTITIFFLKVQFIRKGIRDFLSSTVIRLDHQKTSKKVGMLSNKWINNRIQWLTIYIHWSFGLFLEDSCALPPFLSQVSHTWLPQMKAFRSFVELQIYLQQQELNAVQPLDSEKIVHAELVLFCFFKCSWRLKVANLWDLFCKVFCSLVEAYWVSLLLLFWGQPLA